MAGQMNPVAGSGRRQRLAHLCQQARILPALASLRGLLREDLRILAYHRVLDPGEPDGFDFDPELISASAEEFRRQMLVVRHRLQPMRFDEVLEHVEAGRKLPPRAVLVTFDDGYDDNYHVAFPVLRDLDMSAMFFVSTGHIDSGLPFAYDWLAHMICTTQERTLQAAELGRDWRLPDDIDARRRVVVEVLHTLKALDAILQAAFIERLQRDWGMFRRPHPHSRPMTWDQLREMHRNGMEVGSHGVDHRMLAKLPVGEMAREVRLSKARIDEELGTPTYALSYPVGGSSAFDSGVVEAVREAGFRIACSYIAGTSVPGPESRYALRRLHVERHMDIRWFEASVMLPEVFCHSSIPPASTTAC